jgi:hypothetical protein
MVTRSLVALALPAEPGRARRGVLTRWDRAARHRLGAAREGAMADWSAVRQSGARRGTSPRQRRSRAFSRPWRPIAPPAPLALRPAAIWSARWGAFAGLGLGLSLMIVQAGRRGAGVGLVVAGRPRLGGCRKPRACRADAEAGIAPSRSATRIPARASAPTPAMIGPPGPSARRAAPAPKDRCAGRRPSHQQVHEVAGRWGRMVERAPERRRRDPELQSPESRILPADSVPPACGAGACRAVTSCRSPPSLACHRGSRGGRCAGPSPKRAAAPPGGC